MKKNSNNGFCDKTQGKKLSLEPNNTMKQKVKKLINNTVRMPTISNGLNSTLFHDKFFITSNSQSAPSKPKKSQKDFINDLEHTYLLNQELVITIIQTHPSLTQTQKRSLIKHFDVISACFSKKKAYLIEKKRLASEILINKQIVEESKRRNDENYLYFRDQLEDFNENIGKKSASIKQFHKKFNEVEVFVQREANYDVKAYGRFLKFQIVPFINSNEDNVKLRNFREKEYREIKLKTQLMTNEINEIRLNYKVAKLSGVEEVERGLMYLQRRNEYLSGLLVCIPKKRYRKRDEKSKERSGSGKKLDESFEKRLMTMNGNVIEKQITEISVIEDERNNQNRFEMLETENANVDIKESNY